MKNLNTSFQQNTYYRFYRLSLKLNIRLKTLVSISQANLTEMLTSLEEKAAAVVIPYNVSPNNSIKLKKMKDTFNYCVFLLKFLI